MSVKSDKFVVQRFHWLIIALGIIVLTSLYEKVWHQIDDSIELAPKEKEP